MNQNVAMAAREKMFTIRLSEDEASRAEQVAEKYNLSVAALFRMLVKKMWRSVKYEEVYLRAYESVSEARDSIGRYLDFYNRRRPHSSLDGSTPDQAYFNSLPLRTAA